MIFKIVRKSIMKKKWLMAAILVLISLSSMFSGVAFFTYDTLDDSYQNMAKDGNVEQFRLLSINEMSDLYTDDFIADYEKSTNTTLEKKSSILYDKREKGVAKIGINKYDPTSSINKMILDEGHFPTTQNEVILQRVVAEKLNLKIGDTLSVGDGDYTISGFAYFQEYIYPIDIFYAKQLITDVKSYFPIYMNEASYDELDTSKSLYTDSSYYAGTFKDKTLTDSQIVKVASDELANEDLYNFDVPELDANGMPILNDDYTIKTTKVPAFAAAIPASFNLGVSSVDQEVTSSQSIFVFFSIILIIISISLSIILVNSVFKAQRREMGILKAEGVSLNKLMFGFSSFIFILVTIGAIIGGLLSRFVMTPLFLSLYKEQFLIKYYDVPTRALISVLIMLIIVIVIVTILVTIISIRRNLRQKTLLLIKNIDKQNQPKHNIGKIFKKLSFTRRYQLNLLFRNFSKTILLTLSVLIASFLILMALIMYSSVNKIMGDTFGSVMTYKYSASFNPSSDISYDKTASIIDENITVSKTNTDYKFVESDSKNTDTISIKAYSFSDNTSFNFVDDTTKEKVKANGGIVLTTSAAEKYNVKVGDIITVEDFTDISETNKKLIDLKVESITSQYFLPTAYMDIDDFHKSFNLDNDYHNGYVSNNELTNEAYDKLLEKDPKASVSEQFNLQAQLEEQMGIFYVVILIICSFAGLIGFIALSSISSVIIDSNRKTISVMKVLGYSSKEVRVMTVGIYKWVVIFVYIITIPLIQYLIRLVVEQAFKDADAKLPIEFDNVILFSGLIIIIAIYLLSATISNRSINKIKLSESLKADE